MKQTNIKKVEDLQMRLSFREMISPQDDEWAVINDHEQRINRLETLLLELKIKFEERDMKYDGF